MEIQHNSTVNFKSLPESSNKHTINPDVLKQSAIDADNELSSTSSVNALDDTAELNDKNNKKDKPEDNNKLSDVADNLNNMVSMMQKGLKFSVDKDSGEQVIKVQDVQSGDVIRQIPSEEALKLAEKMSEVSGILMKIEV